jgi:hypothetical protein
MPTRYILDPSQQATTNFIDPTQLLRIPLLSILHLHHTSRPYNNLCSTTHSGYVTYTRHHAENYIVAYYVKSMVNKILCQLKINTPYTPPQSFFYMYIMFTLEIGFI